MCSVLLLQTLLMVKYQSLLAWLAVLPDIHVPKGQLLLDQLLLFVCLLEGGMEHSLHVKVRLVSQSYLIIINLQEC